MKKLFTLIVALVATLSTMAQMHGTLQFVGNGEFYLPAMQAQTQTATVKDTVTVTMGSETQSFDIPDMYYASMNMTIKSFNIPDLAYTMTGSYVNGNMAFEWHGENITTTTVGSDGSEKSITVTEFNASYTHASGELKMSLTFTYGSMPFALAYSVEAYYTKDNELGLVGQGTQGNPYKIYDANDFMAIANKISKDNTFNGVYFDQMADIDFGGNADAPVQLPAIGKEAITNIQTVAWGFEGTYDGHNKAIKGIYHTNNGNDTNGKFNALFSSIGVNGTVKNVIIDADNYISSYNYVASIASVSNGTIENCTNNADITAANAFAAGICGSLISGEGTIRNCVNNGNIKAMTYATGIIACAQSGTSITTYNYLVEDCTNHGNTSSTNGTGSAGIAGTYSGALIGCSNDGNIDDTAKLTGQYTAGILSCGSYITEITNCSNKGTVTGNKNIGGIVGNIMKGNEADIIIKECQNEGEVQGNGANIAGIIGNTARVTGVVTIADCANYGKVSTTDDTTELIGNLRGNAVIVINGFTIGSDLSRLPLDPEYDGVKEATITDAATVKNGTYIKNGRIVIVKDGNTYSVTGIKY